MALCNFIPQSEDFSEDFFGLLAPVFDLYYYGNLIGFLKLRVQPPTVTVCCHLYHNYCPTVAYFPKVAKNTI